MTLYKKFAIVLVFKFQVIIYGFISPDGEAKDVFVHVSQLEKAGLPGLDSTQRVGFEIYDDRGRIAAGQIKIL